MKQTILFCLLLLPYNVDANMKAGRQDSTTTEKASDILMKKTEEELVYTVRKRQFIEDALNEWIESNLGAALNFELETDRSPLLYLDGARLKTLLPMSPDYSPNNIPQAENPDIPRTIPLSRGAQSLAQALTKKKKRPHHGKWAVPGDMEIDILKVLWVAGKTTASDIYAKIDSSSILFAEELREALDGMVDRGFLDRKKVSASHPLNLFGFAQIELSAKNRKNKIYLYWPIVTRKELHSYLDAKRYLALVGGDGEDSDEIKNSHYLKNHQKRLEDKLIRMFE